MEARKWPFSLKFPVFSLHIRESSTEASSQQTDSFANFQSAAVEAALGVMPSRKAAS
jgi:hypothetical protein